MHSQNSFDLVEQALAIHKENTRLVRLSAAPRNYADYWFSIHNTPEDADLKTELGYKSGREFKSWWINLYDTTKSIREIRNSFESIVVGTDKLLDYGTTERPSDRALGPHGMDILEWTEFDEKMARLVRYLFVWVFRRNKSGDRTDYTRFLKDNPYNVAPVKQVENTSQMNLNEILTKNIPGKLFDSYSLKVPETDFTEPYPYISSQTTKFFISCFPFDKTGNIARSQFLKDLNSTNYNFNKYWSSLPDMYSDDSDIMDLLNTEISLEDGTKETLFHLGATLVSPNANSKSLAANLQNLINLIRNKEVEILKERWIKIFKNVGLASLPLLNIYNTTLNLQGAMGARSGKIY